MKYFKRSDVEFCLTPDGKELLRNGLPMGDELSQQHLDVLRCMVDSRPPHRLITKEELIKAAWGDTAVTDNSLTKAVSKLRSVLGDDPDAPSFIKTVARRGYRFIAEVSDRSAHNEGTHLPTREEMLAPPDIVPPARPLGAQDIDWTRILQSSTGADGMAEKVLHPDDLNALEDCVRVSSNPILVRNALTLIERLATGWDGRTIKRAESFDVIKSFYRASRSPSEKAAAARALASLGAAASRAFLVDDLKEMEPQVLASTLAVWDGSEHSLCAHLCVAFWENLPYWRKKVAPVLTYWLSKPVHACLFVDEEGNEIDCRCGVLIVLGKLEAEEASEAIAMCLSLAEADTSDVVVEAAGAYWRITGSERFAPKLEAGVQSKASARAKYWLEEIRLSKVPKIVVTSKEDDNGTQTIKGVFTRNKGFSFTVYLDELPSVDTFRDTRIAEMYISAHDVPQWSWGAHDSKEPTWCYGRLLLSDLVTGMRAID
jgi:DNA-binding winged helix-turn-helix (wHTH) protein